MDMTREALQYVVGLNKPEIINIDGASYTDKELVRGAERIACCAVENGYAYKSCGLH